MTLMLVVEKQQMVFQEVVAAIICYAYGMTDMEQPFTPNALLSLFPTLAGTLILLAFSSSLSVASNDWLDLVRVEDGKYSREIIYQQKLDQWQPPVSLTKDSRTDDFTPVSIRTASGDTMVLWKESTGVDASRLVYCLIKITGKGSLERRSPNTTIKTITAHQSSPTLIRAGNGAIWGFWVGFNGKDDDIFYAQFDGVGWGEEKRLFDKDNGVPDLKPTARININGELELRWRQFSFAKNNYIDVFSRFEPDSSGVSRKWSAPNEYVVNPLEKIPRLPSDFTLPEGVSQPDSATVNFSGLPGIVLHWNNLPVAQE